MKIICNSVIACAALLLALLAAAQGYPAKPVRVIVSVPAGGTPRDLVMRIRDDVAAVLQIPDVRQRLLDIGGEPGGQPQEEFAARIRYELENWQKVAKAGGLKPQ